MGLEKPNSGLDRGETFFPNSGSDLDSDETFQISRNVGLDIDEIVCLLDSQLWVGAMSLFNRDGIFKLFRSSGIDSVSLCSLVGRYDNPVPSRFLVPIHCYKTPELEFLNIIWGLGT